MYPKDYGITDDSIFVSATATPISQTMPFYMVRAGYFKTTKNYYIKKQQSSNFLLMYTVNNCGVIETENGTTMLPKDHAIIIDCTRPHCYYPESNGWDFYWFSLNGCGVSPLIDILYPEKEFAINLHDLRLEQQLTDLIDKIELSDINSCITRSVHIHNLLNTLLNTALNNESLAKKKDYRSDIDAVISFIHDNYHNQITLDDILKNVHISKYHFIRIFHRIMGSTPYNYLTSYRINIAKTMLCSTGRSIADIAYSCGFLDTSQFIRHFKKHTGMKPLQYRMEFGIK